MIDVVVRKELSDHWRDRRSVLGVLVLPIMGPLLLLLLFNLLGQQSRDRPLHVPIVGAEHAPQLIAFMEMAGARIEPPPIDPERAVIDGDVPLVLRIDADYQEQLAATRSAPLEILVDESNTTAGRDIRMLQRVLAGYGEQLTTQRLIVRGLSPEVAKPLAIRQTNVAAPERTAARVLSIIPLLLVLVAFIGGMNIAIDTTAGERERRSLEPLLLNPVDRLQLLLGKWIATSIFAIAVLTLAVVAFIVTVTFANTDELGVTLSFGLQHASLAFATLVPLALLAAALQMLVATFARTFKEAQTYLSLVTLIPIAPTLYLMLNPGTAAPWMMFVPAMAQVASITDILGGDPVPLAHFAVIWLTSLAYTAATLFVLRHLFYREQIIFGR